MDEQIYTSLIFEWQQIVLRRKAGVCRQIEDRLLKTIGSRPIKIVTGFRRSGKSFLVQQVARHLLEAGKISPGNLLYLNLEDFRLMEVTSLDRLNRIYEMFLSISAGPGKKLLIFDEIQNVASWDRFIRTIYERDVDVEIILTGSNSELLSSELGSNLAGRFIEFFLYPFSFREFLDYRKAMPATSAAYLRSRREINALFMEYLAFGGLPEVFDIPAPESKRSYLSGIISKVILDDVVRRFRVDNITLLEKLFHYLMAGAGGVTTFASLARKARGLGIQTKNETIISYCNYLLKSFALLELAKFNWKQGRVFSDSRKYYSIDNGLITLYRAAEENLSLRLEHVVLHELLRRHGQAWYGANDSGREIDFMVSASGRICDKYQVTVSLTPEDEKRELGAFALADPHLRGGTNLLLSLDEDEEQRQWQAVTIQRKNVVRWLLGV
ncbi:MAG: ATP-binding protein [Smithellaceae bacterium]|nr:ATP-binding protein [Smithellaceae bacterium]